MPNALSERYRQRLQSIPAPGGGCHVSLLGAANLGVMSGLPSEQIFSDIRQAIPHGKRKVSDREINEAIAKALQDYTGGTFTPRPRPQPVTKDGKETLLKIIAQGKIDNEVDLWEASPIRLLDEPKDDQGLFLSTVCKPSDLIWIGEHDAPGIIDNTLRSAADWITYFQNGGKTCPHIIVNPLDGKPAPKKSGGGETFRGDGNVTQYRYCLVEFDDLSRQDQIRFWSSANLPVVALIDSGGKSIHAWLDVSKVSRVTTEEQWESQIETCLYERILIPLGVDRTGSNPSRLSRLPGHFREEKQAYQRLLWLSPEGRPV